MTCWPRLATIVLLPLALAAQGIDTPGKAWFIHLGMNKVDTAASGFTPVAEVGVPIYRYGHNCLGMFGGGTQWTRGAYTADEMRAGDLLQKRVGWAGLYGTGDFLTLGLGAEYARAEIYVVPAAGNGWYDDLTRNRAGGMGFISLHGRNGFGGFFRCGSQSGVGLGLSLNF
jgi:hypothetical protein